MAGDATSTPDGKTEPVGKTTPPVCSCSVLCPCVARSCGRAAVRPHGNADWAHAESLPPLQGKDMVREAKRQGESWQMLIIKDGATAGAPTASHGIMRIPHPRHGDKACFILTGEELLEVRRAKGEEYSCWFVGNYCQADSAVAMATPVDPLFLAIAALEASRNRTAEHAGRFCSKEQIFASWTGECPEAMRLAGLPAMDLAVVCDVQMVGDEAFVRLSDDKVLAWLRAKVLAVLAHLCPGEGADGWAIPAAPALAADASVEDKIAALAAGDKAKAARDRVLLGAGLVCEYLSSEWAARLLAAFGLAPKDLEPGKAGGAMVPGDEQFRSIVSGSGGKREADGAAGAGGKKAKVVSNAERLAKKEGVKGMQSLSSFFKPKPKA
jgi:hypothetical protein